MAKSGDDENGRVKLSGKEAPAKMRKLLAAKNRQHNKPQLFKNVAVPFFLLIGLTLVVLSPLPFKLVPYRSVSGAIKYAIKEKKKEKIILKDYTDFEWEKFYVFGPYTPAEKARRTLGFDWPDYKDFGLEFQDGFDLLVFTKGDNIVRAEQLRRSICDFQKETLAKAYSPENAVFKVTERNNRYKINDYNQ